MGDKTRSAMTPSGMACTKGTYDCAAVDCFPLIISHTAMRQAAGTMTLPGRVPGLVLFRGRFLLVSVEICNMAMPVTPHGEGDKRRPPVLHL